MSEQHTNLAPDIVQLLEQARDLKKWPLAKLISIFESKLPQHFENRHLITGYLRANQPRFNKSAKIIGFTGTPGAGKSSLIAELCRDLLDKESTYSVAVLAVDPSSQVSGGSILGDRTRMHYGKKDQRLFFRSQASNLELGGITESTFQAVRLLRHFFDLIIVETVGIGQNEIDIQYMSDHIFLVMQPLAGDQIQFMKCGIMEIPDSFVINKCDEDKLARTSYHMLRGALKQAHLVDVHAQDDVNQAAKDHIFLTSATKRKGIDTLAAHIKRLPPKTSAVDCEAFYLQKSIRKMYGLFGEKHIQSDIESQKILLNAEYTYEEKEKYVLKSIHALIKPTITD